MKYRVRWLSGLLLALGFWITPATAADFLKPTAVIDRTPDKKIRLSITWTKLNQQNFTDLSLDANNNESLRRALVRLLDICLVLEAGAECSDSVLKATYFREPTLDQTPETSRNRNVTADVLANTISFVRDPADNTYTVKADIEIASNDSALPIERNTTRIAVRIVYKDGDQNNKQEDEKDISFTYALGVNDEPKNALAISSKQSVNATWDRPENVLRADNRTRGGVSGVLAILVAESEFGDDRLPTRIYNDDYELQATTSSPKCSVRFEDEDGTLRCTVSCEGNEPQTIVPEDLEALAGQGVQFKEVAPTDRSVFFDKLSNDANYAIILQFQPDGLKRTCLAGRPSEAFILTQTQTGREPKAGDAACFIATAAYGSALDSHLETLRWFRDQHLLTTEWGRSFVRSYYEWGPPAAAWIADKPFVRAAVRGLLWLPVLGLELLRDDLPAEAQSDELSVSRL